MLLYHSLITHVCSLTIVYRLVCVPPLSCFLSVVTVTFNEATYSVIEGQSETVIVTMESTLDMGVTVNLMVNVMSDTTDDYNISPTLLTFTSDDTSEELTIDAISDSVMEVVETSTVTLTQDDGSIMFTDTSFDVDISDASELHTTYTMYYISSLPPPPPPPLCLFCSCCPWL